MPLFNKKESRTLTSEVEKKKEKYDRFKKYGISFKIDAAGRECISFLGVDVLRAEIDCGDLVPDIDRIQYDFNDFNLGLIQSIAIAWRLGEPVLVEAGAGVGKNYTYELMCALLGYELYLVPLNQSIDAFDLIGSQAVNPDKKTDKDKEFVFRDEDVTKALRQSEGRIRVVILDELNAGNDNSLLRLHSVIDRVTKGGFLSLKENFGELIWVDSKCTKVGGAMNPPNAKYHGTESIQGATMRRFVYLKGPERESKEDKRRKLFGGFGIEVSEDLKLPETMKTQTGPLSIEQMQQIPDLELYLEKILVFHETVQAELDANRLAADQSQVFDFDDTNITERIHNFVATFYDPDHVGEPNKVLRSFLRFYYVNKLESEEDRNKVRAMIDVAIPKALPQSGVKVPKRNPLIGRPGLETRKNIPQPSPKTADTQVQPKTPIRPNLPPATQNFQSTEQAQVAQMIVEWEKQIESIEFEANNLFDELRNVGFDSVLIDASSRLGDKLNDWAMKGWKKAENKSKLSALQVGELDNAEAQLRQLITKLQQYAKSIKPVGGEPISFKFGK